MNTLLTRLTRWYFSRYLAPLIDERIAAALAQQPAAAAPTKKRFIGE
jgi:hypothetical protein